MICSTKLLKILVNHNNFIISGRVPLWAEEQFDFSDFGYYIDMIKSILDTSPFTLSYKGQLLRVTVHIVQQHTIYFIQYPGNTPSLKLFHAKGIESPRFWTSIPENTRRSKEADEIGAQIFAYYVPEK